MSRSAMERRCTPEAVERALKLQDGSVLAREVLALRELRDALMRGLEHAEDATATAVAKTIAMRRVSEAAHAHVMAYTHGHRSAVVDTFKELLAALEKS